MVASASKCKSGRGYNARKKSCKRGHPFTEENTYQVSGKGSAKYWRRCRTCKRLRDQGEL